jgi:hypothetical protein
MSELQANRIIVILGSGRSGTSLLMQVLASMGMSISENLITANFSNPEGPLEDSDILQVHREIFRKLGVHTYFPLPEGWMNANITQNAKSKLSKIVRQRLDSAQKIWGFKDPSINTLLPLWFRLFNPLRITPIFILTVRNPHTTVASFFRQYNEPNYLAELAWLTRTVYALHHTAADCFIVHYEDWFTRPKELAQDLLHYTGLNDYFSGNLDSTLPEIVKPNLNRSASDDYVIKNSYVIQLYECLKDCSGNDFDRNKLMSVVQECRQAMDGFKGWYLTAQENIALVANLREQLNTAKQEQKQIPKLEKRIEELERENQRLSEMEKEIQRSEEALNHLTELYLRNSSQETL